MNTFYPTIFYEGINPTETWQFLWATIPSTVDQTIFHMNPKPNADFTEPLRQASGEISYQKTPLTTSSIRKTPRQFWLDEQDLILERIRGMTRFRNRKATVQHQNRGMDNNVSSS